MTKQPVFSPQQPLTYFDALQILRIVKSTEKCESVRLRFGETKISLERISTYQGVRAQELPLTTVAGAPATTIRPSAAGGGDAEVTAPIVGFFHRWSGPGEIINVQVGDMVRASDTIGIVKAVGVSKPIVAGVSGRVTEVPVADAGFVEYGQPVLRVKRTDNESVV